MSDTRRSIQSWLPSQQEALDRTGRIWITWFKMAVATAVGLVLWISGLAWMILPRRLADQLRWWHTDDVERIKLPAENQRAEARFADELRQATVEEDFWREFWGTADGRPPPSGHTPPH